MMFDEELWVAPESDLVCKDLFTVRAQAVDEN
jgi:hypothetical protein